MLGIGDLLPASRFKIVCFETFKSLPNCITFKFALFLNTNATSAALGCIKISNLSDLDNPFSILFIL